MKKNWKAVMDIKNSYWWYRNSKTKTGILIITLLETISPNATMFFNSKFLEYYTPHQYSCPIMATICSRPTLVNSSHLFHKIEGGSDRVGAGPLRGNNNPSKWGLTSSSKHCSTVQHPPPPSLFIHSLLPESRLWLFNMKFLWGACSLIRGIDNLTAY